MTFKFGTNSLMRLENCDTRLQKIAQLAISRSPVDFAITCGHRGQEEQDRAFREGKSRLKWPQGKHNKLPSQAFDFVPFTDGKPDWTDLVLFGIVAREIKKAAKELSVEITWGGDWVGFKDHPHIELKG